ncbi:MAG: hypothetical protein IJL12_04875 [Selenomonadaceae bacterium]|nr:hypothetical protein [Selenomonadaceae bacterium]MBQ7493943.1 hypothetical protein [Selenomonadaceae bacterium]
MMVSNNGDYAALNADKFIRRHSNNAAASVAKLSSGIRINTGADDPAGIVTAGKLKGNASAADAAAQNAQNAAAWGRAADAAYGSALDILYRMKEIAVQKQDVTLSDTAGLDAEMSLLNTRLTQIGSQKFAGQTLFNTAVSFKLSTGSTATTVSFGSGVVAPGASATASTIDTKIAAVAAAQGTAGGSANALGYFADGLAAESAAMWSAYDDYTQTNTASEMTKFVRNSVYAQSAQYILSQYNQNAYSVLNLLR